jgi:hypothetical protein
LRDRNDYDWSIRAPHTYRFANSFLGNPVFARRRVRIKDEPLLDVGSFRALYNKEAHIRWAGPLD